MADTQDDIVVLTPGEEEQLITDGQEEVQIPAVSISFNSGEDKGTGSTLSAVEGVIRRQSARLDELREQLKTINDQLKSILDNDEQLSAAQEEVKASSTKVKQRKSMLAGSPESLQLKYKQKDIKESITDIEESLSNHLLNLFQMTGSKEFDTDDGAKREFDVKARLRSGKKKQD